MAQTVTQKNPDSQSNMATGRILDTGTVAAFPVVTGFKPRRVVVMNNTSGDIEEWIEGMAAASAMKRVAAGTCALITTLGITVSDYGFTIGLDTDINVTSEQLTWAAYR